MQEENFEHTEDNKQFIEEYQIIQKEDNLSKFLLHIDQPFSEGSISIPLHFHQNLA
jgi:hypothetical protein